MVCYWGSLFFKLLIITRAMFSVMIKSMKAILMHRLRSIRLRMLSFEQPHFQRFLCFPFQKKYEVRAQFLKNAQ